MGIRLVTLGRFELQVNGRPMPPLRTQKARAVTAYLVFHRARDISRERLLELFWPEFEEDRAKESLRTTLSTIRRALRDAGADPSETLFADKSTVRWHGNAEVDAEKFLRLAGETNIPALQEAELAYTGDFLEGNFDDWVAAERERLTQAYENVLAQLVKLERNTEAARKLLAHNPYVEEAYAVLIEAEMHAHRNAEAQALLAQCYRALAEVGSKPSAEFSTRFGGTVAPSGLLEPDLVLPFVGRANELHQLDIQLSLTGEQRAVVLVGEAGIGKTAILREGIEFARRAGRQVHVLSCGQGALDGIGVWQRFYEQLTGASMDDAIAHTADIAGHISERIIESLRAPSALFFDDAHALRGDALATLVNLVPAAGRNGHCVIVAIRPEGGHVLSALSATPWRLVEVGPLARVDVDAGLTQALRGDVADLSRVLFERSGGHPLFLVSLLESLSNKHAIQRRNGKWHLVRTPEDRLDLPGDLRASVEARLRDAGEDAAVVACALALEPSANVEEVSAALEYDSARVLDALDELLAFSLIAENRATRNFRFVHDVVREVAANMLNIGRRVSLHRSFARCFESRSDVQSQLRLAEHLRAAGLIAPAAQAFAAAAQAAVERNGFRDALEWTCDALDLLARNLQYNVEHVVHARLHRVRAYAAAQTGDFEAALEASAEAVRYARSSVNRQELLSALLFEAALKGLAGDAAPQRSGALEAITLAEACSDESAGARAKVHAATAARLLGNIDEARRELDSVCDRSEWTADALLVIAASEELVRNCVATWDFRRAFHALAEAGAAAESAGPIAHARFLCMNALYFRLTGDWNQAWEALRAARNHLETLPQRFDTARPDLDYPLPLLEFAISYTSACTALAQGRLDEAVMYVESYRANRSHMRSLLNAADVVEIQARLARRSEGDLDRARDLVLSLPSANGVSALATSLVDAHLSRLLVCAFNGQNAAASLRRCLDTIEERAHLSPLDADRAFALLSDIAQACGEGSIAKRAAARSAYYGVARNAAAAKTLGAG